MNIPVFSEAWLKRVKRCDSRFCLLEACIAPFFRAQLGFFVDCLIVDRQEKTNNWESFFGLKQFVRRKIDDRNSSR